MTITQIAENLLTHFAPEERSIPDSSSYAGRNAAVMAAMNGACQELWGASGPFIRRDERGYLVHATKTVTISVTNGSRNATISVGWETWMVGCSIAINGSAYDNQIRNEVDSVKLRTPHDGPTGSVQATVYCDCISLEDDVVAVMEPVVLDARHLGAVPSGKHYTASRHDQDYGFHRESIVSQADSRLSTVAGRPVAYAVESWSPAAESIPVSRLRLQPAPREAHKLELSVRMAPPKVTDIEGNTNTLPIPHDYVQSIYLPFALQRLKGSPFYRSAPGKDEEIVRSYQAAQELIRKIDPRRKTGKRLVTPYS